MQLSRRAAACCIGMAMLYGAAFSPQVVAEEQPDGPRLIHTVSAGCENEAGCGKSRSSVLHIGSWCQGASEWREFWRCKKARQQYRWWGYPEEFEEVPLGAILGMQLNRQMQEGEAARLVLYHYDFEQEDAALKYRGRKRLARMTHMLSRCGCPVVIQETPDNPSLDEARRVAVLRELSRIGLDLSPERVMSGLPTVRGLRGVEAQVIDTTHIGNTTSRGTSLSSPASLSPGFNIRSGNTGGSRGSR